MKELLAKRSLTTVMNRLQGRPASRPSAFLLAAVAGIAGAVGAYKFLRSGGEDESESESDSEGQSESEEESEEEAESA